MAEGPVLRVLGFSGDDRRRPPLVDAAGLDPRPATSEGAQDRPDRSREILMQEDSARDIEFSTPAKEKDPRAREEGEGLEGRDRGGAQGAPRAARPRSALFGGLRPEGSLKARAIALIREHHMQKMNKDDKKAKVKARENRSRVMDQEKQRFRERLAKQKERQQAEEKDARRKRAEAARRRAQRRQQQQTESDRSSRPVSAASNGTPAEPRPPASDSAPARDQGGETSSQPREQSSAGQAPSQFGTGMFTVFVKYRGMPRSQSRMPVSLDDHEYATMTVLRLKEHIASLTGVHSHASCQVVLETSEGLANLSDAAAVADVLQQGASLILQLHLGSSAGGKPASARQQASEGWIHHQGRAVLWRGHQMDLFPKELARLSKDQMSKLLRQASLQVNSVLREEDLRKQLADAAGAWEVERILACETPSQVLRVPGDAAPVIVKSAFRKVSMLVHPDKNQHENASKAMQAVTAAFRSLYLDGSPTKPKARTTAQSSRPSSVPPGAQRDWAPRVPRPISTRFSRKDPPVWPSDESDTRPQAPTWGWQEDGGV